MKHPADKVRHSRRRAVLIERLDGRQKLGTLARGGEASRRTLYALSVLQLVELRGTPVTGRRREGSLPLRPADAKSAPAPAEDSVLRTELAGMAERMRAYLTSVFQHYGIENEERSMDPDDDDAADFRVTQRDIPMIVTLCGLLVGIVGIVWWAVA